MQCCKIVSFLSLQGQVLWVQTMASASQKTHKVAPRADSPSMCFVYVYVCEREWSLCLHLCVSLYPVKTLILPHDGQKALKRNKDGKMNDRCPQEGCFVSLWWGHRQDSGPQVMEPHRLTSKNIQKIHFTLFNRSPAAGFYKLLSLTISAFIETVIYTKLL